MEHLKFDLFAMAQPKSRDDYDALLDEALLMADNLCDQLSALERAMIRNAQTNTEVGAA